MLADAPPTNVSAVFEPARVESLHQRRRAAGARVDRRRSGREFDGAGPGAERDVVRARTGDEAVAAGAAVQCLVAGARDDHVGRAASDERIAGGGAEDRDGSGTGRRTPGDEVSTEGAGDEEPASRSGTDRVTPVAAGREGRGGDARRTGDRARVRAAIEYQGVAGTDTGRCMRGARIDEGASRVGHGDDGGAPGERDGVDTLRRDRRLTTREEDLVISAARVDRRRALACVDRIVAGAGGRHEASTIVAQREHIVPAERGDRNIPAERRVAQAAVACEDRLVQAGAAAVAAKNRNIGSSVGRNRKRGTGCGTGWCDIVDDNRTVAGCLERRTADRALRYDQVIIGTRGHRAIARMQDDRRRTREGVVDRLGERLRIVVRCI